MLKIGDSQASPQFFFFLLIPENQSVALHIDDDGLRLVDRLGQNHLRERVEQLTRHHVLHGMGTLQLSHDPKFIHKTLFRPVGNPK